MKECGGCGAHLFGAGWDALVCLNPKCATYGVERNLDGEEWSDIDEWERAVDTDVASATAPKEAAK